MTKSAKIDNRCRIPCGNMPSINETNFGKAIGATIHPNRVLPFNVMIYIISGKMEIYENDIPHILSENSLFFLRNGLHHYGTRPFKEGTTWYYVHFNFAPCNNITEEIPSNEILSTHANRTNDITHYHMTLPKHIVLPPDNKFKYRIKHVVEYHNSGDVLAAAIQLWEVLRDCYNYDFGKSELQDDDAKMSRVADYLNKNYNRKINHVELEEEFELTYKYLSTLFKKKSGMTIKQYQLSLRLKKSAQLLYETNLSIAQISQVTGFYDAFYFSKIFKREFGIPPLKYRNTYRPKI